MVYMNRRFVCCFAGGALVVGEVAAAFEMGMTCSRNCMGVPVAVIAELVHLPEGNNNHYSYKAPGIGIAGGNGNNNFA